MQMQIQTRFLDGAVLALISQNHLYGYALTQEVKQIFAISDSTVYPVLKRLRKENLVITYDEPFQGRNRRYYQITASGKKELETIEQEWWAFRTILNNLMGERN